MTDDIEIIPDDPTEPESQDDAEEVAVAEPGKLLRIALMLRSMQDEVRRAGTDDTGRALVREVHERALNALGGILSGDLRSELAELTLPFSGDVPTESEILIAQAQLIGWLEGLFQGIQAAIANQQVMARQQLEQMRHRGLPVGQPEEGARRGTGQYL